MAQKDITLDAWNYEPQILTVIQGEMDTRTLCFHLMDGEKTLDLTGKSVTLFYHKPNGSDEFIVAEVLPETAAQGIAKVLLPSQACAVPGVIEHVELRICNPSGANLRFRVPDIMVVGSTANDEAVEGSSEFQALSALLGTVQESLDRCSVAAQEASVQARRAEIATDSISDLKEACEQVAVECTQLAKQIGAAIEHAETAAESCEQIGAGIPDLIEAAIESKKGQANGIASLDAAGKLTQMPGPQDIGAASEETVSQLNETVSELNETVSELQNSRAIPNGIATLDANGKLVQMPTAEDVGITNIHQTLTATEKFNKIAVRVARIGNVVTVSAPIVSNYQKPVSGEDAYPVMVTLPAEYRPSKIVDMLIPTAGAGDLSQVQVNPSSGNISVGLLGSSSKVNLRVNFSYSI